MLDCAFASAIQGDCVHIILPAWSIRPSRHSKEKSALSHNMLINASRSMEP